MESFDKIGMWFLPETPDRKVTGQLIFAPEKIPTLKLFGELKDFDPKQKLEGEIKYEIIHGYLIGDKGESDTYKVTLCNCVQKKEIKTGIQNSEIYAGYILQGYHFSSLDEIKFTAINVQYTYLEKWINSHNITIEGIPNENNTGIFQEINLKQQLKESIEIGKINDCSITVFDEPFLSPQKLQVVNFLGYNSNEILVKEQKSIQISSEQPKKLNDLLDVAHLIQEFLTFGCGQIISICDIKTYTIGKDYEYQLFECQYRLIEIEKQFLIKIFYAFSSHITNQQSFDPEHILFKFTDIIHKSDVILNNWKTVKTKLTPIIETYLGLYYIPVRYIKDSFLALAQAVEGFHRIHHKGEYCDKDIFQKISEELEKVFSSELAKYEIDESYHESLLKKIEYWNEYSLKERLEDLLSDKDFYNCIPDTFFTSDKDREDFAKQVRDTRGALTHPSSNPSNTRPHKKPSKNILSGNELEQLINKLKIILEICFLKSLELDPSEIKVITSRRF